jgi:hypothetical protein
MGSNYPGLPSIEELRTYRENIRGKMSYFFYATANQAIGIGGPPAEPQIQIDARSDFLALEIMGHSDQEDVAVPVNFYTIEIANSSSGRAYQSNPLIDFASVGTGQRPHYLAVPMFFQASSSIALRLVALNAAVAYNIRIVIGGVKIMKE